MLTAAGIRWQSVPENRRRVAVVQGICIARRNRAWRTSFTIRNHIGTAGGIERTFPLCAPLLALSHPLLRAAQPDAGGDGPRLCEPQVFAEHTRDRGAGLEEGPQGEAILPARAAAQGVPCLHQDLSVGMACFYMCVAFDPCALP